MDNRKLNIALAINENVFTATDNTNYDQLINDGYFSGEHAILDRLVAIIDGEHNTVYHNSVVVTSDLADIKEPWTKNDVANGLYYFQRIIISTSGSNLYYNENSGKVCKYDSLTQETILYDPWEDFDDVFSLVEENNFDNSFFFGDYSFSMEDLIKCWLLAEKDRIQRYLRNNCSGGCEGFNDLDYKVDILMAAVLVLQDLVEKGDYFEAQRILNGLNTCGDGLCKEYKSALTGCGCGTI